MGIIDTTAKVITSEYPDDIKLFRNTVLSSSKCGIGVTIGDDTTIERCLIGNYCSINRRNYINDSNVGDFSYTGINTIINFATIGKFCSIARNVDIGGADHDIDKITSIPRFRIEQCLGGGRPVAPKISNCEIGNDVWIASGAIVLNKAKIGDGAVIGAGAVVTKDIPPYAIAVGIPAKVVKYRCSEDNIERLLKLRWWDWPLEVLKSNINHILNEDISDVTIEELERLKKDNSYE